MKKFIFFIMFASVLFMGKHAYAYEPMIYDNGWIKLSESELSEKMNAPVLNINTDEPFNFKMVKGDTEAEGLTNTPLEYYSNVLNGYRLNLYTTYDIIDGGLFEGIALPLIYYKHAKPSKYSYVRDFSFAEGDPLAVLPVDFVFWAGSDQREFIEMALQQRKSWRDVSPNARIIKTSDNSISLYDTCTEDFYKVPDDRKYTGEFPSHVLSAEVMGDLNNDGYEDMVVSYAHYYVQGSGKSYHFVVLTRISKDDIFRDITDEVDRIIWSY
jgi:hypothetical protein